MDQRIAFIADWLRADWTLTELSARYQISRKTAYKWIARYEGDRAGGLADRSRAPKQHARTGGGGARGGAGASAAPSASRPEETARDAGGARAGGRVAVREHDGGTGCGRAA
jgi:hypothetical protein